MKRAIILPALVTAFVALSPMGVALADNPHSGPPAGSGGQPGKTADVSNPGVTSPAGFGTGGFAIAEGVYANPPDTGSQGGISSGGNLHVVSQYDVAGFQWCQHHTCPPPT